VALNFRRAIIDGAFGLVALPTLLSMSETTFAQTLPGKSPSPGEVHGQCCDGKSDCDFPAEYLGDSCAPTLPRLVTFCNVAVNREQKSVS